MHNWDEYVIQNDAYFPLCLGHTLLRHQSCCKLLAGCPSHTTLGRPETVVCVMVWPHLVHSFVLRPVRPEFRDTQKHNNTQTTWESSKMRALV